MSVTKLTHSRGPDYLKCRIFDSRLSKKRFKYLCHEKLIFLAKKDKKIIDYVRFELTWLNIPYLSWITVEPNHRRKGIDSELMKLIS